MAIGLDEKSKRELEQKARKVAIKIGYKSEKEKQKFVTTIITFFENTASNNFEANLSEEYLKTLKK